MRGPLQDIRRGEVYQPLAAEINAWNGAARSALFGGGGAQRATPRLETVQVVNQSGQDFAAGAVMGLDRPLVLPEDDVAAFLTDRSWRAVLATEAHRSRLVFAADMIRDGESGRAFQSGSVRCQIAATEEVLPGSSCGLGADEDVTLTAGVAGYEVIWASAVNGGKAWAEIRPAAGGANFIYARIQGGGSVPGVYSFREVRFLDPEAPVPAGQDFVWTAPDGVYEEVPSGAGADGTILVELNRWNHLQPGDVVMAWPAASPAGPHWVCDRSRKIPPGSRGSLQIRSGDNAGDPASLMFDRPTIENYRDTF